MLFGGGMQFVYMMWFDTLSCDPREGLGIINLSETKAGVWGSFMRKDADQTFLNIAKQSDWAKLTGAATKKYKWENFGEFAINKDNDEKKYPKVLKHLAAGNLVTGKGVMNGTSGQISVIAERRDNNGKALYFLNDSLGGKKADLIVKNTESTKTFGLVEIKE